MRTFPPDEWLRSITFLDTEPEDDRRAPVHCTSRILLNHRRTVAAPIPGDPEAVVLRSSRNEPIMVQTNGGAATSEMLASFVVRTEDLVLPNYDEVASGIAYPNSPRVGPFQALIPPVSDVAHRWVATDADHTRVWLQVAEVLFAAVRLDPEPVDVMPDGDEQPRATTPPTVPHET